MASFREGKVTDVVEELSDLVRVRVALEQAEIDAVGFPSMLGAIEPGDRVIVNTTGLELGLGTGGVGFLLWNLDGPGAPGIGDGHIVKLRYTPWQTEVLAAEAPESPHHDRLAHVASIYGMPVVAAGLHSQVAGIAAGIKAGSPRARVGYLMTDAAALPLAWSRLARDLKGAELVDVTCTCGHAFGGDLEAVNVFSGLASLRSIGEVDVAIVAMGPGGVGTSTALGFSGIEQGQVLDAATALGGRAIASLRVSFADERSRHKGVSHHSLTALTIATRERATVAVPALREDHAAEVERQLRAARVYDLHDVVTENGAPGMALLAASGVRVSSMGHSMEEVPEPFIAAAAAGAVAATLL